MKKNVDNFKPIYETCIEFHNYEEFIKHKPNKILKGYFFDKESIDEIKELICYEKVKSSIKNKQPYPIIKDILKTHYKNKVKNILPKKFNNSQELIQ